MTDEHYQLPKYETELEKCLWILLPPNIERDESPDFSSLTEIEKLTAPCPWANRSIFTTKCRFVKPSQDYPGYKELDYDELARKILNRDSVGQNDATPQNIPIKTESFDQVVAVQLVQEIESPSEFDSNNQIQTEKTLPSASESSLPLDILTIIDSFAKLSLADSGREFPNGSVGENDACLQNILMETEFIEQLVADQSIQEMEFAFPAEFDSNKQIQTEQTLSSASELSLQCEISTTFDNLGLADSGREFPNGSVGENDASPQSNLIEAESMDFFDNCSQQEQVYSQYPLGFQSMEANCKPGISKEIIEQKKLLFHHYKEKKFNVEDPPVKLFSEINMRYIIKNQCERRCRLNKNYCSDVLTFESELNCKIFDEKTEDFRSKFKWFDTSLDWFPDDDDIAETDEDIMRIIRCLWEIDEVAGFELNEFPIISSGIVNVKSDEMFHEASTTESTETASESDLKDAEQEMIEITKCDETTFGDDRKTSPESSDTDETIVVASTSESTEKASESDLDEVAQENKPAENVYQIDRQLDVLVAKCKGLFRNGECSKKDWQKIQRTIESKKELEIYFEVRPVLLFYLAYISCYLEKDFRKAIEICEKFKFPQELFRLMQMIWDFAQEKLECISKNRDQLTCVQRFRLKQKLSYPKNIWDGRKIKYGMSGPDKEVLIKFYENVSRKPNKIQKDQLAKKINSTPMIVATFFKNRRNRSKERK